MVFVVLSYGELFNPVLLDGPSFFGFLWIFFLFKLFRRSFFCSLLLIFFFYLLSEGEIFVLEVLKGLFCTFGSFYSTIFIETCQYYRAASPWDYLSFLFFTFFFLVLLDTWILILSLRYAVFLLGFCSFFLLRGFRLVYLFERWRHSNFASTRIFFESHLRFSSPHMLQPNCRGNDWSES